MIAHQGKIGYLKVHVFYSRYERIFVEADSNGVLRYESTCLISQYVSNYRLNGCLQLVSGCPLFCRSGGARGSADFKSVTRLSAKCLGLIRREVTHLFYNYNHEKSIF